MHQKEGKPFFIYALVCPLTLEVKYVGQTGSIEQRRRGATHMGSRHNTPLTQWQRTLGYLKPYMVILERGINRRIEVTVTCREREHIRGRKPTIGAKPTWLSFCLEAKWIKRFRRTIINQNKTGEIGAWQVLVNPSLPWGNASDAPADYPSTRVVKRPKANRDAEIVRMRDSGMTTQSIVAATGLSERRIQDIVQHAKQ